MQNQDKKISQFELAAELSGLEMLPFAMNNANGAFLVSLLKEFIREGLASQSAVNGKQNALTPGHGIEITADNVIKVNLDTKPFKVVETLPTSDIENKIYLLPDPDGSVGTNEYIEYVYLGDHWEVLGKFTPSVNLAPYLKTTDAERIYAKKTDIPDTSGFATTTVVNTLAEQIAQLTLALNSLKTRIDSMPAMPINDGKTYGIYNGVWTPIADVGQVVASVKADEE